MIIFKDYAGCGVSQHTRVSVCSLFIGVPALGVLACTWEQELCSQLCCGWHLPHLPMGFPCSNSLDYTKIIPDLLWFVRPNLQGCQEVMHGSLIPSQVPHLELAFYFSPFSYFVMTRPSPGDMLPAADVLFEEPQAAWIDNIEKNKRKIYNSLLIF